MKNHILILVLLVFISSCSNKKEHEESGGWRELDSFHKIMAEAFHPIKDSGNIQPAKKLAAQMADEADRWASASLPEKVNNDEMKSNLQRLKADTRSLSDEINKGAADDVVKEKLISLHDQFHKIMEAWQGGHDKDEGEEDEDHEEHEEDED
jgi:PBP1b-binding outer membrane lipoprotein LpoB